MRFLCKMPFSSILSSENQDSKLALANSQNASRNSVLRVENIGTQKTVASSIF